MALADVLQLVADISDGFADQTAATSYNADVIQLIGTDRDGTLTNINTPTFTLGPPAIVGPPATFITILDVLYEDNDLSYSTLDEITMWDPYWRGRIGEPKVWTPEGHSKGFITATPSPSRTPTAALPLDPTATDPGSAAFTFVYTEARTDVHPEEELALALEILCREFSRDSDHTDRTLAQSCRTLSGILFRMIALAVTDHMPAYVKALEENAQ